MSFEPRRIERIRTAFDQGEALALLRRAIAVPSVTGEEKAFAELLARELKALGASDVTVKDFAPGRPNVSARLCGDGGGPRLLLTGHTDTVHVRGWAERWSGNRARRPFRRRGGRRRDLGPRLRRPEGGHLRDADGGARRSPSRPEPAARDPVRVYRRRRERRAGFGRQRRHEGLRAGRAVGRLRAARCRDLCRADAAQRLRRADGFPDLRHLGHRQVRLFRRARARRGRVEGGARRAVGAVGAFGRARAARAASARWPAFPARHRGQGGRLHRGARRVPHQPDPQADPRPEPRRGEGRARSRRAFGAARARESGSPSTIPPAATIRSAARRRKRRRRRLSSGSSSPRCAACVPTGARSKARPSGPRRRSSSPGSASRRSIGRRATSETATRSRSASNSANISTASSPSRRSWPPSPKAEVQRLTAARTSGRFTEGVAP